MDFACAGLPDLFHFFAGCCASDDGVVDDDDAFVFDDFGDNIEFEADGCGAFGLGWFDECTAYIAVGDDAFAVGDA